jgi:DNA transposition AAA+ family ATPase
MSKLYLESSRLETSFAAYPDEMKEAAHWLAGYLIQNCNRSAEILASQTKKLGYPTHESTFTKVMRGQWNRNAEGKEVPPIISQDNFLAIVESLRKEQAISTLSGAVPYIDATSTYRRISDYITAKRSPQCVCKYGVIVGATGSGKSAAYKHYRTLNNHGAVIHIEAPFAPSVSRLVSKLAACYGVSAFLNAKSKLARIVENINDRKCVIIDNAQRLYKEAWGTSQSAFNYLQELQDDTNCTIILSITPETETILTHGMSAGYFEQFEGRSGGRDNFCYVDSYPSPEDTRIIAEAFGLKDAKKHLPYLVAIGKKPGRIRILFNTLQTAKTLADAQPLTIKHVQEALRDERALAAD